MPASISLNTTALWPSLAETLAENSRKRVLVRETAGADVLPRTLDRANGMERTGTGDYDQYLFGGIVAGKGMDWAVNGNFVARDAIAQTFDCRRGMLTVHLGAGNILDTSI